MRSMGHAMSEAGAMLQDGGNSDAQAQDGSACGCQTEFVELYKTSASVVREQELVYSKEFSVEGYESVDLWAECEGEFGGSLKLRFRHPQLSVFVDGPKSQSLAERYSDNGESDARRYEVVAPIARIKHALTVPYTIDPTPLECTMIVVGKRAQ